MAEIFPSSLQDVLNVAGFGQEFGNTTIRSQMDVGPEKVRQRFTRGIDTFTSTIDIDYDDYATLSTFFKTTLAGGSKTFNYDHPMTGIESEFRFVSPPAITPLGGRKFRVQMTWEEIP